VIHLHYGWDDAKQTKSIPLKVISIGIAVCGAKGLPRGTFVNEPKQVTCPACVARYKQGPATPSPAPEPAPEPKPEPPPKPVKSAPPVKGAPTTGTITALVKHNPRKPGSGKFDRMSLLLKHNGQSVEAFAAAGGNLETLRNAIREGIVSVH
jgi:hypothetical protein